MSRLRSRVVYLVLLPAIAVAAAILGYYAWVTATQFARLGEQTIAQSTLLILTDKVDRMERQIIEADNTVFDIVDPDDPEALETKWLPLARSLSPSIRSALLLDDTGNVVTYASRADAAGKREFMKVFLEQILPDLELERQRPGRLKHLHGTYGGTSYLISYQAMQHRGRRFYAVAHHDTHYIVREQFPELFATEEGKLLYNVVDESNRRVFGESLTRAGDYLVARRFPTTLYGWRVQLAPKQAPQLDAQGRSRRMNEVALIAVAFAVILLGVAFVLYAGEKERRLNALKADFVANVSHELKTPLSVVRMFGEMLLTNRVRNEEKRQEYLEIICRESERLSSLIENVLDFAALERGKKKFALREGDLVDVVTRAVETFRYRIEQEGTEVHVERPSDIPQVSMDEQAVLLAVINLLDNAVKYGGGSPVTVSVAARKNEVAVSVRDRGPGIPKEDLKRVFERFYRTRRKELARGSGIGLALVKHIAEAHGGHAWAENAQDGGAIVGFTMALRQKKRAAIPTPITTEAAE